MSQSSTSVVDRESELLHYGVPGMKWGVRKDRDRSRSSRPRRKMTNRQRKILKRTALAAGVTLALGAAAYATHKTGVLNKTRVSDILDNPITKQGSSVAKNSISSTASNPYSSIRNVTNPYANIRAGSNPYANIKVSQISPATSAARNIVDQARNSYNPSSAKADLIAQYAARGLPLPDILK